MMPRLLAGLFLLQLQVDFQSVVVGRVFTVEGVFDDLLIDGRDQGVDKAKIDVGIRAGFGMVGVEGRG